MALGKKRSHFRKKHSHRNYTPEEAANLLAPPEEQAAMTTPPQNWNSDGDNSDNGGQGNRNGGSIVIGTGELKLPVGFESAPEKDVNPLRLDPVVVYILIAALVFIAFIAYLISNEAPR